MVPAVPGQERDAAPGHLADRHRVARRPIGGVDLDLFGGVEELKKPDPPMTPISATEDMNVRRPFSPAEPEDPEALEAFDAGLEDEESLAEVLPSLLAAVLLSLLAPFALGPGVGLGVRGRAGVPAFSLAADPLPERLSVR